MKSLVEPTFNQFRRALDDVAVIEIDNHILLELYQLCYQTNDGWVSFRTAGVEVSWKTAGETIIKIERVRE